MFTLYMQNLYKGRNEEVTLTRQQVCCLLALCFLNGFPLPKTSTYQHFTLALFLSFAFYASQRGKLLCILHYFDRVRQTDVSGNNDFLSMCISVTRHHVKEEDPTLSWGKCESPLTEFESPTDGGLIEGAHGCLQVDFANAYIGGGVLNMGNVQVNVHRENMKIYFLNCVYYCYYIIVCPNSFVAWHSVVPYTFIMFLFSIKSIIVFTYRQQIES